jgi:hypothetical protein
MNRLAALSAIQAVILTLLVGIVIHISPLVIGAAMSSSNFSIQSDTVNFGGGYSTSSNFSLESTAGEIATGNSDSASFQLRAGYQQMQEVYISLAVPSVVPLSPALPGVTGGTSTGLVSAVVVTDSPSGYTLAISATNEPAMQSGSGTIADYEPTSAVPDFLFVLAPTDAVFGFTPEGSDIDVRYQDAGGTCGVTGGDTLARCWDGLATTSRVIARKSGSNHPSGATTTIRFQVGLGGMIAVPPGSYVATTTIIALPQ